MWLIEYEFQRIWKIHAKVWRWENEKLKMMQNKKSIHLNINENVIKKAKKSSQKSHGHSISLTISELRQLHIFLLIYFSTWAIAREGSIFRILSNRKASVNGIYWTSIAKRPTSKVEYGIPCIICVGISNKCNYLFKSILWKRKPASNWEW